MWPTGSEIPILDLVNEEESYCLIAAKLAQERSVD